LTASFEKPDNDASGFVRGHFPMAIFMRLCRLDRPSAPRCARNRRHIVAIEEKFDGSDPL